MSAGGSITHWIQQLQAGDALAVEKLWQGYFPRLVRLARKKLRDTPRRAADEEDVALSAFDSFCQRAQEGRFPRLSDRDDLWQVLVLITARKAIDLVHKERRQKRGGGRVQDEAALAGDSLEGPAFQELIGREPDPQFAAQVAEEYDRLLETLGDAQLQSIAVWKMEGDTNAEIAAKLDRSEGTVERKLRLIRSIWESEVLT